MNHTPNFLNPTHLRPRRWLVVTLIVIIVLGGMSAIFARPSLGALRAWQLAEAGKAALDRAEMLGSMFDVAGALAALRDASNNFEAATRELEKLHAFRSVPWLGRQIRATEILLRTGRETTVGIREALAFGSDLLRALREIEVTPGVFVPGAAGSTLATLTREEKRAILERFLQSVPKLEAARERINAAFAEFSEIPLSGLAGPLAAAIRPLRDDLPRARDYLNRLVPLVKLLPAVAGYPDQNQTLILFLNNAELRPGGGFIGTVGRLEIADGTILGLETRDAYAIDRTAEAFLRTPSPAPIARYLNLPHWFMRDANWSPDFTVSAQTVIDFYERETAGGAPTGEIDNLIAFTPSFASEILRITGPITIEDQTFTAENLFDTLEYQVERGFSERGVPYDQRKEILAKLVDRTIARLSELPLARWEEITAVIERSFREKQLMIYDRDPAVQEIVEMQGSAGSVDIGDGDFFMVVDANLGSLKSDPVVKRTVNYHIEPDGNGFEATISITYRHEGRFDWKTTRYRTYTRLYVPPDAEFKSASGHLRDDKLKNPEREPGIVDVGMADDLQGTAYRRAKVFGAFTAVEPGEERTLSFIYRPWWLPGGRIEEGSCYTLKVQKQLGSASHELTVDLEFGKTPVRASPREAAEDQFDTRYTYRTDLGRDRYFEVCF